MDILQVSIVVFLLLLIAAGYFFLDRYYRILLRKEVIRARRSEHIKTVFLANVSHALRNPLNSIITKSNHIIAEGAENFLIISAASRALRQMRPSPVQSAGKRFSFSIIPVSVRTRGQFIPASSISF